MTDIAVLQNAFKTPTLRNADRRAPFMHDGSEKTLADVVELYNVGGRVKRLDRQHRRRRVVTVGLRRARRALSAEIRDCAAIACVVDRFDA